MVEELKVTLSDGNTYRFIEPEWSPGTGARYVCTHPEYVAPHWKAHEILVEMPEYTEEELFRMLTKEEKQILMGTRYGEVFARIREWARPGEVREA